MFVWNKCFVFGERLLLASGPCVQIVASGTSLRMKARLVQVVVVLVVEARGAEG